MAVVPLGEVRNRLSEYVAEVELTHERITITRHGHPAAVLISADDLASIEETLEVLRTPGASEAIREGLALKASTQPAAVITASSTPSTTATTESRSSTSLVAVPATE